MPASIRLLGLVSLLLVCATSWGHAQAPARDTVHVGDRVRVQIAGDLRPIVGRLQDRRGDTLMLQDGLATQRVLVRAVNQAEVSLGRSRSRAARHDALWGAGIGGGILALSGGYGMKGTEVVLATAMYAGIGAAVGALRRPERWRLAALPPSPPVAAITPAPSQSTRRDTTNVSPAVVPPFRHTLLVLQPRDVIRFRLDSTERVAGTLVAGTADSLLIDRGGLTARYSMQRVREVQRYYGKTARAGAIHGGKVGGAIGVVLGGLFGLALSNVCFDTCSGNSAASGVAVGAFLFGGIGGAVGAGVGQSFPRDDWRTIRWDQMR